LTPEWVYTQDDLRQRLKALLDNRKTNGWTPTALAEAMGMECTNVIGKAKGGWIGTGEQKRMSRVLREIEAGRLIPAKALFNFGFYGFGVGTKTVAQRVKPPEPPKPEMKLSAKIGKRGLVLQMDKPRLYSHAELYRMK
jgi:hypothetical protein